MRVIAEIKPGHKEIYDDLFSTPPRERADRLRFLAMLGSLVLKGQVSLHGGAAQGRDSLPLVEIPQARQAPNVAQEKDLLRGRMARRLVAGLTE